MARILVDPLPLFNAEPASMDPKLELFLFDLDGTLVDTAPDITASANHVLTSMGRPAVSTAQAMTWVGDGLSCFIERALGDDGEDSELVEKGVQLYQEHHREHLADRSRPYPGVVETLRALEGRRRVVITNKPEAFSIALLEGIGLAPFFDAIHGPESFPERKPSPVPIVTCLDRYNVEPQRAIMIGDSLQDIRAGQGARVQTAAVTYGFRPREELVAAKPDHVFDRFDELLHTPGV